MRIMIAMVIGLLVLGGAAAMSGMVPVAYADCGYCN
jgi:Tfp pilus assembly protein PilW